MLWSKKFAAKFLESVPYINNMLFPHRKRVNLIESAKELPSSLPRLSRNAAFVNEFNALLRKHFKGRTIGVTDTNSMEPFIDWGHLPILIPFNEGIVGLRKRDLIVGDVILFHRRSDGSPMVLHRIIDKKDDGSIVMTRGDNTVWLDGKTTMRDIKYICAGVLW